MSIFKDKKEIAKIEELLTPEVLEYVVPESVKKLVTHFKWNPIFWIAKNKLRTQLKEGLSIMHKNITEINRMELFKGLSREEKLLLMLQPDPAYKLFASGNKPAWSVDIPGVSFANFTHPKLDVVTQYIERFGETSTLFNREQVKALIEKHKSVYCNRLGCKIETSVDEIYLKLLKAEKESGPGEIDDIFGISMGFPRKNTLIFQLHEFANKKYGTDYIYGNLENASKETVEKFKDGLRRALKEKDSPYANADKELIKEIEEAIEQITEVKGSDAYLKKPSFSKYPSAFVMFLPEPEEIERINNSVSLAEKAIESGKTICL